MTTIGNERYKLEILPFSPRHRNKFVAEIKWMSGDADAYETTEMVVGTRENDVYVFLDAVTNLPGKRWGDRWPSHQVELTDSVKTLFGILTEQQFDTAKAANSDDYQVKYAKDYADYLDNVEMDAWPRDVSCDDCGRASFDGYNLYWYDQHGLPHQVKITFLMERRYR